MNIIVNRKTFPFESTGGTCITTYEYGHCLAESETTTILKHTWLPRKRKRIKEGNLYIFDIGFVANLKYIFKYKANINRLEIHSALSIYGLLYALFARSCGLPFFYSGHGSFDSFLLEGGSFPFRMYRQIRMRIFDICCLMLCKKYILNSIGEGEKLALIPNSIIRNKLVVRENSPPLHTLNHILIESGVKDIDSIPNPCQLKDDLPESPYLLFIGRVVAKKCIIETMHWVVENSHRFEKNIVLIIAHCNDDQQYLRKCKLVAKELGEEKFIFIGPAQGLLKLSLIKFAYAGILKSKSEGNPIFAQECLMLGTRLLLSPQCNIEPSNLVELI